MTRLFRSIDALIAGVSGIGLAISAVLLLAMAALGTLDALFDNIARSPIPLAQELSEISLAASVFLALAHSERIGAHVRVDIAIKAAPAGLQRAAAILSFLVCAVFLGLMAWSAWGMFAASLAIRETAAALIPLPIYPAKAVSAFGISVAFLAVLRELVWFLVDRSRVVPAAESHAPENRI